ncbi:MAG TPA: glucose-6-phosphate isomerase [Candidatus Omnitrophota bacterium]|nr:glucose-6-phosphate isomerase [Candidatus Omnitrophota bacterium]
MEIRFDTSYLKNIISDSEWKKVFPEVEKAHNDLTQRRGAGKEFTGWLDLPSQTKDSLLKELVVLGQQARKDSDCVLSLGIGGSYLGVRATLEFLISDQKIPVYYAGNNLSAGYLSYLLSVVKNKKVTVVVISKSGTTTETALAFRIVKAFMDKKYNKKELQKRIICITDEHKGALRKIADKNGYRTFPISDDVGGRFSVLCPAGLVSLALAGVDIRGLIEGARYSEKRFSALNLEENIAYQYAAARYLLTQKGKKIEVLSSFYQRLMYVTEWWKQLFGESEGKNGKGLFPSSLNLTADLHSMGQLMQDGERNIFETFLMVDNPGSKLLIPSDKENLDNFNCVAGKELDYVNKQAYKATAAAHFEGGIPSMTITVPDYQAHSLGQLYYFFEKAVAISGYMLKVNPFDQPGVEAYKKKMFELLGRY